MSRIGIFGGSFDPVHVAHLILAERVREARGLDMVLFVPAGAPPHKPARPLAPAGHRLRMLELAVEGNPGFAVSPVELERDLAEEVVGEIAAASRTEHVDPAEAPVRWVDRVFGSRLAQAVGAVVFVAICLGLLMVTSSSISVLAGTLPPAGAVPMP